MQKRQKEKMERMKEESARKGESTEDNKVSRGSSVLGKGKKVHPGNFPGVDSSQNQGEAWSEYVLIKSNVAWLCIIPSSLFFFLFFFFFRTTFFFITFYGLVLVYASVRIFWRCILCIGTSTLIPCSWSFMYFDTFYVTLQVLIISGK